MTLFESHITVEPVFDDRLDLFNELCKRHGFQVARLLLQKRKESSPTRSDKDSFCTGRDVDVEALIERMKSLIHDLSSNGFIIWRYKIEQIIVDSKQNDVYDLIT